MLEMLRRVIQTLITKIKISSTLSYILVAGLSIFLYKQFFPSPIPPPNIPIIVTKTDTVHSVPSWLDDSIKVWKKIKYITDTFNLTKIVTVVDTQLIPVNAPPELRPKLNPLLSYHSRDNNATVRTYSLQTGSEAISSIYNPGYVTDIEVDSNLVPRMNFKPFPVYHPSLWTKLEFFGLGFGSCSIANKLH